MPASNRLRAISITQSDTTTYGQSPEDGPHIKFIDVFEVDVTVKINNGVEDITYTSPSQANGGIAPWRIFGPIHKVYDTDTSAANASLIGYV